MPHRKRPKKSAGQQLVGTSSKTIGTSRAPCATAPSLEPMGYGTTKTFWDIQLRSQSGQILLWAMLRKVKPQVGNIWLTSIQAPPEVCPRLHDTQDLRLCSASWAGISLNLKMKHDSEQKTAMNIRTGKGGKLHTANGHPKKFCPGNWPRKSRTWQC